MAKKKLTKIEPRIRQKNLGLTKPKSKFVNCSFRLGRQDKENLGLLALEMNCYSRQKKITMTDALRAIIQYCAAIEPPLLLKSLRETL